MYPFIHIGPLTLGTYGILVAAAAIAAYFVLRADLRRRGLPDLADTIVLVTAIAGIVGAKLYHVLETPRELFADPAGELFSRAGFAWAGSLIAGVLALLRLARYYKLSIATMFDVAAPAAALGYAVGRIGCLISGDGDYGKPTSLPWGMRFPDPSPGHEGALVPSSGVCQQYGLPANCTVHPTPIYELIAGVIIFWYLWKLGARALRQPRPRGEVIAEYFVWTGVARFLVEFIRINPRSFFGVLSNAQLVAAVSIAVGIALLIYTKKKFKSRKQEHRIVAHSRERGEVVQPEYHQPTPECPHPERWSMYDSMTAEVEVLEFLRALVTTLKPNLVVETGTFMGISSLWIAEGLKRNGFGKLITCEYDPAVFARAAEKIYKSGLQEWIDFRNESSLEAKINGTIDLLFCDSAIELREQEVRRFLPQVSENGVILMHDASSHLKTVREAALRLQHEGLVSVVLLPTPRGLVLAQRPQAGAAKRQSKSALPQ
jgi:prolipoprotein diacylglyceryl transferase